MPKGSLRRHLRLHLVQPLFQDQTLPIILTRSALLPKLALRAGITRKLEAFRLVRHQYHSHLQLRRERGACRLLCWLCCSKLLSSNKGPRAQHPLILLPPVLMVRLSHQRQWVLQALLRAPGLQHQLFKILRPCSIYSRFL